MGKLDKDVEIQGEVLLKGTLTIPDENKEKYPAVLLIPGTGGLNRDGNAKGLKLNLYRELADWLTSLGFATLLYDKRGIGESAGKASDTSMNDLVDDAESCLHFLKKQPTVDPENVFVLGHSEGAILATALNVRQPLSGLLLLAGAGMKLDDALKFQQDLAAKELNRLTGIKGFLIQKLNLIEKSKKKNEAFFQKIVETDKEYIRLGIAKVKTNYFREHFTYPIFEEYKKISCPVLAITGKRDIQANHEWLQQLPQHIESPLEIHAIENMNHGLKEQKDDESILAVKKLYKADIGKPLHNEFTEKVSTWLQKQTT